jgi:hypothetical protein
LNAGDEGAPGETGTAANRLASLLETLAFRANVLLIMQFALCAIFSQGTGAEKGDSGYYQQ